MKNHWLQNYKKRNNNYWTAEFYGNNSYILSPRRVDLLNFNKIIKGGLSLIFKNAVHMQADQLLNNFFSSCQKHIDCWTSKLCSYNKMDQIESFELYDLSFVSLSLGSNFEDIVLKFNYENLKQNI